MSQAIAKLKGYIQRLFTQKEKFSLAKLMVAFEKILIVYKLPPRAFVFTLFKSHYQDLDRLLSGYERKNRISRMKSRKQTARQFFEIVSQVYGAIPKCLQEIPNDSLPQAKFEAWKKEQKNDKKMLKDIVDSLRGPRDINLLRHSLEELQSKVVVFTENGKLQRFVAEEIKKETVSDEDYDNFQIGGPTIVHGPKVE